MPFYGLLSSKIYSDYYSCIARVSIKYYINTSNYEKLERLQLYCSIRAKKKGI